MLASVQKWLVRSVLFHGLLNMGQSPLLPKRLGMILCPPRWKDLGLNVTVTEPLA